MKDQTPIIQFRFISESDYHNLLEAQTAQCLVRMKVFNGELQVDLDRTVFFEIDTIEEQNIVNCLSEIKRTHFSWAKSFFIEKYIRNSKLD